MVVGKSETIADMVSAALGGRAKALKKKARGAVSSNGRQMTMDDLCKGMGI